jgi:hypothetical protein
VPSFVAKGLPRARRVVMPAIIVAGVTGLLLEPSDWQRDGTHKRLGVQSPFRGSCATFAFLGRPLELEASEALLRGDRFRTSSDVSEFRTSGDRGRRPIQFVRCISSLVPAVALRRAIQRIYDLDRVPSEAKLIEISDRWRPYRSLAVSYLFASEYEEPR